MSNQRIIHSHSGLRIILAMIFTILAVTPIALSTRLVSGVTSSPTPIPISQIVTDVVHAPARSAWIVMPDYNTYASSGAALRKSAAKCGSSSAAMDTDIFATMYLVGAFTNPQNEILDTNLPYILQATASCGLPSGIPSSAPIVIVAGPLVNEVTQYYVQTTAQTVLYFDYKTTCLLRRDTNATVACGPTGPTQDVLAIEAFRDTTGRPVYVLWGIGYQGTFAAITYLVEFILKNPASYSNSWYVFRWSDASSGSSANSIPDAGDSYTDPPPAPAIPLSESSVAWQYFALGNGINPTSLLPRGWIGGTVFNFWDLGMTIDGTIAGYKNSLISQAEYQTRINALLGFLETMQLGCGTDGGTCTGNDPNGGPYGLYSWDTGTPYCTPSCSSWNGADSGRTLNALAYLRRTDPSYSTRIDNVFKGRLKTWLSELSKLTYSWAQGTCVYGRDFELGFHQFRYLNSSYDRSAWLNNFYNVWVGSARVTDAYGNSMPQMFQVNFGPIAVELLEKGDDYSNTLRYAQDMMSWAAKRYAATGKYSAWGTELHVKLSDGSTPTAGDFLVSYVPNVGYKTWQTRPDTTGVSLDETSPLLASTSSSVDAVYSLEATFPTNSWVNSIFVRFTQPDLQTSYGFRDAVFENGGVDNTVSLHHNAVILLAAAPA